MSRKPTRSSGGGDPLAGLLALTGAVAVIAGAFGAHGASGAAAEWLKTGAQYALIHALAGLIALHGAGSGKGGAGSGTRGIAGLFLLGATIFAGTLYAMALGGPRMLGAVTPIGGLAMILGWLWWAVVLLRGR